MAYKTVAVVVTDPSLDRSLVEAAFAFAGRMDAHLDIWALAVDETRYEPLPAGSAAILLQENSAEARARAHHLADWAEALLPAENFKFGVEPLVLPHVTLETMLAQRLRYADLCIAHRPYGAKVGPLQVQVLETALFRTGAPCLVLQPGASLTEPPRRIAIAWDGSDAALVAVRKARPLLTTAELVSVVMVDPPRHSPDRSDPGGALAQYLARHGVHTQVSVISRSMSRISDCLLRFARDQEMELMVMGAYGHSRMREALVGGPTRHMLQDSDLPILMAH